ncbi:unnamed protein product [Arctogadus glacialis]
MVKQQVEVILDYGHWQVARGHHLTDDCCRPKVMTECSSQSESLHPLPRGLVEVEVASTHSCPWKLCFQRSHQCRYKVTDDFYRSPVVVRDSSCFPFNTLEHLAIVSNCTLAHQNMDKWNNKAMHGPQPRIDPCPMSLPTDLPFLSPQWLPLQSYSPGIVDPSEWYCGFPLDFSNYLLAEICIVHPYSVRALHMFTDLMHNDVRILFFNIKDVGPEYC